METLRGGSHLFVSSGSDRAPLPTPREDPVFNERDREGREKRKRGLEGRDVKTESKGGVSGSGVLKYVYAEMGCF